MCGGSYYFGFGFYAFYLLVNDSVPRNWGRGKALF